MRARNVAPFILPAWVVVLCGCFNYGLPYPSDMSVDTEPDPDVSDVQDSTEPDTELDPDLDVEPDAPPAPPVFVEIPAGSFTMGSSGTEPGHDTDEDEHSVTLTRSFEMMEKEVTHDEFHAALGYRPSSFGSCADCPVETVNWHEAAAYANALSLSAGFAECYACSGTGLGVSCSPSTSYPTPYECPGYRLPTEAEWERAARAGTTDATYSGTSIDTVCESPNSVLDPIAWFCGNSSSMTHSVGGKTPNAWGLYDMLGNVHEWCNDWYSAYAGDATDPWGPSAGTEHVVRGGSWDSYAGATRAAYRYHDVPGRRENLIGFRLVRTLP